MKYLILDSQIRFYHENGFIEFEDVFSQNELESLRNEIQERILKNQTTSFIDSLKNLRDLFRTSDIVKKIILNNKIISILKNLTNHNQFRLAFDQTIFTNCKNPFDDMVLIDDFFSFQGLLCIVIIKLDSDSNSEPQDFLPKAKNSLIFLKPTSFFNFKAMFENPQKFFFFGYCNVKTIYRSNPKDPNSNFLKTLGYNFGDVLINKTHPLIY